MFSPLQSEIAARFSELQYFFVATRNFKEDLDLDATVKGLMFIQLYAAYEFTVKGAVQVAIDAVNMHGHKFKDIRPSLMALYLDPELESLRNIGIKKVWPTRLQIFEKAFSDEAIALSNNTKPPTDGTHYRHTHLMTIFHVFGISRMPARRRSHLYRIDEVVNNRNQIAHGEETASDIGRRYTRAEITRIIGQMKSVCEFLLYAFDGYCTDSSRHRRDA